MSANLLSAEYRQRTLVYLAWAAAAHGRWSRCSTCARWGWGRGSCACSWWTPTRGTPPSPACAACWTGTAPRASGSPTPAPRAASSAPRWWTPSRSRRCGQQGPGASAIPGAARARLGAALILPYFTLPTPGGAPADGGPRPENARFAHNAAGALPTYLDRERDPGYGAYYLVGDSLPREQARNELGGDGQANAAHYVELFAALAALDFTARGGERDDGIPIYRATGVGSDEPGWGDLPVDRRTRRALKGALVAMHTFLTFFRPNGSSPPELAAELHGVTWADLLRLPPATWSDRSDALDAVGLSWMSTWEWLRQLRRSTPALRLAAATADQPARVPTHALIEGFGRGGERGRRSDDVYGVFRAWNTEAARRRNGGFGAFMEVLRAGSERFSDDRFPEAEQPGQEED